MLFKPLLKFIRMESSAGIILFLGAVLAMIVDNSPLRHYYHDFFSMPMSFHLGVVELSKPVLLWVNDGLMAIFFLLVGLEIKREIVSGELSNIRNTSLPIIAALGGVIVPGLIYVLFNYHSSANLVGWAIPTATDIAFSLGILSLLGRRVPITLKVFLTALAIFDDIAAILIIAVFYTSHISYFLLGIAALLVLLMIVLNRLRVTNYAPYFIIGFILWVCILKSGVHATLAGIIIAMVIPSKPRKADSPSPALVLEHQLHPWVAYLILPIFAFANSGVSFAGVSVGHFFHPVCVGIFAGLFIGKQIGVWLFSFLSIQLGVSPKPKGMTWLNLYGVSLLAGVGFTMSLFIGSLAFTENPDFYLPLERVGVISGSLLSGLLGYLVLRVSVYLYEKKRQNTDK